MADDIGYNDGISAFENWFRKLSVSIKDYNAWSNAFRTWANGPRDTPPPLPPLFPQIPLEGPLFDEKNLTTWPWPNKFFRNTMRKLKDYYDAVNPNLPSPPPPPPPPPPISGPWDSGYAPRSYNMGSNGQNCKFNVKINCTLQPNGDYLDKNGIWYQDNGLCRGGRSETPAIPELKPSDMSDGLEPWDSYEWMGNIIGPNKENYPADSYKK